MQLMRLQLKLRRPPLNLDIAMQLESSLQTVFFYMVSEGTFNLVSQICDKREEKLVLFNVQTFPLKSVVRIYLLPFFVSHADMSLQIYRNWLGCCVGFYFNFIQIHYWLRLLGGILLVVLRHGWCASPEGTWLFTKSLLRNIHPSE